LTTDMQMSVPSERSNVATLTVLATGDELATWSVLSTTHVRQAE
jgi:hypothetical protein